MSPEAQRTQSAFNAWCPGSGRAWEDIGLAKLCFYAGFAAATEQAEAASPDNSTVSAEEIYAAYPRKVGKQGAIKAIKRLAFHNISPGWLLERTKAYAEATSRWPAEDRQYIPHPATWFNRGSYDDDPKEWERGTAPASQFSQSH
ncbi:hypothetical protein UFOVP1007_40 [uncultured Caudovirales phage]|uniref:Uncharacterized protein n=1 Tax=uncultured Caudovirales phage TaxID=2100421 RepID=A0A6J5PW63_9CAUD|nr:hypothetical protein UFOVP927_23 [uncultured Caudovirales phage]CAB4178235.1 hypothetical protein UFOVP1007_40 [uncultured Caudovirales phage]CAB4187531.1 hypothetical protein UFOVP1159_40 [uncultured Caudovirales phage]